MSSPLSVPTTPIGYASDSSSGWWAATEDEATPELRWPLSVGVYDRMRRQDAQVASVLRAVTLPVLRTPWRIDPAGARDEVVQRVHQDLGLPRPQHDSAGFVHNEVERDGRDDSDHLAGVH